MYHYRKTRKTYESFPEPKGCDFCNISNEREIVKETEHVIVVHNRVSYDVWELRDVKEHLMVIPKRHVHTLNELSDEEKLDIMHIMADYEAADYNVYARSQHSISRSVAHQHTHLIKTGSRIGHGTLFMRKPYFFIKF